MAMLLPSSHAALPMHPMARKLSFRSDGAHEGLHIRSCRFHSFENQLEDYWRFFECNLFAPALSLLCFLSFRFFFFFFLEGAFCFLCVGFIHTPWGGCAQRNYLDIAWARLFVHSMAEDSAFGMEGGKVFLFPLWRSMVN
ncbi:hypothetical protein CEXT_449261 [Caerostris extrusa]|uniref:Uncharacterized protein n=1 Tax=Caerostris extrusa TaxID=172846 RepID=A0AAV4T012_CAEEX|nr:hypothetical protein CEXT_449261 [Caerostris extrusa]